MACSLGFYNRECLPATPRQRFTTQETSLDIPAVFFSSLNYQLVYNSSLRLPLSYTRDNLLVNDPDNNLVSGYRSQPATELEVSSFRPNH